MNLFFLDEDLPICASYHVDRHVVKIITEANQCMACAYPKGVAPYRWSYYNHPMTVWVRSSRENFNWTVKYCLALCGEYSFRYQKIHAGEAIAKWYASNPPQMPSVGFTDPPRCFGESKGVIPVTASIWEDYRQYYRVAKSHLFKWKNRPAPPWLNLTS